MLRAALSDQEIDPNGESPGECQVTDEHLQLALEAARLGVWEWDIVEDRVVWSDRVYEIHGMVPGTAPTRAKDLAALFHPEDRDLVTDAVLKALRGEDRYEVEFRILTPDGEIRWITTAGKVIRDTFGNPIRLLGTTLDTTERRRQTTRLEEANRALQRMNENLRQFAYAAAHDLKEPLRMVGLYSQLLSRKYTGRFDPAADDFLRMTVEGARRMQELVDDLLAFTETGDVLERPTESVDCNAALDKALRNLATAIHESGADISSGPLPTIHAHMQAMTELFQNLVANAIKYRRDSEKPRVQISCSSSDGTWTFSVEDNGIGIDPSYHNRIFGIFKRLHKGKYPGTGIGLAICQRVVERYNGRIWVDSAGEGHGSTFRFTIPRT
jgi:PAS domain S-box-containing protein